MPKDTHINIRIKGEDKKILQSKAQAMSMSLTEYLIHAGVVYEPSDKVKQAVEVLQATMRGDLK